MKKIILTISLAVVLLIISTTVFAKTTTAEGVEYVRVEQVYCGTTDIYGGNVVEKVVVALTEAGKLHMNKYGYNYVVVQVIPKWYDSRSSRQVTIDRSQGYNTINFNVKSEKKCGKADFTVQVVEWI